MGVLSRIAYDPLSQIRLTTTKLLSDPRLLLRVVEVTENDYSTAILRMHIENFWVDAV
ncbi:hypothetical protein D3C73_1262390 [compost metagenome]